MTLTRDGFPIDASSLNCTVRGSLVSLRGSDYVDSISSRDEPSSETVDETGGSPHNPALFIMHPTPLLFGLREHVSERCPEPEGTVTDGNDRGPHVTVT